MDRDGAGTAAMARVSVRRPRAGRDVSLGPWRWHVLRQRVERWPLARFLRGYLLDCQAGDMAASVAFHAMLYCFPLIAAIVSVIGLIVRDPIRLSRVSLVVVEILPPTNWGDSLHGLLAAKENAGLFGLVSVTGLFWFGASFLASLARAFNAIYDVPPRRPLSQRLLAMGLILVVALLVIVTVMAASAATGLVRALGALLGIASFGVTARAVTFTTGLFTAFALFLTLDWLIPNARFSFQEVWPGAAFSAVCFIAATQIFPLYIRYAPTNRYGAVFSLVFLLTTWFYLLAHILLLGAAINAFRRREARERAARARR